jgi:hypothetical protein
MPAEQDPNEFESMRPGYRHLTQGEFDRLKRALAKRTKRTLPPPEGKIERELMQFFQRAQTPSRKLSEVRELLELKRKLDERDKELAETRQELAKARNQFLAMVAIAALIPVFMFIFYLLVIRCPAPHW